HRRNVDDLPDDTVRIEQRLTDVRAAHCAAIDVEALPIRIEVDGENLGGEHAVREARRGIEQLAKAPILRLEGLETLQLRIRVQLLALQVLVLGKERTPLG